MIRYQISSQNPLTGYIQVNTYVPATGPGLLYLQLPAWRPGRYELQQFAQKIRDFAVRDENGQPIPSGKLPKTAGKYPRPVPVS
jgi:predicted metalloprotease with PDZ domain